MDLKLATRLGVSADPFLMGVAVAASCAFLTPTGAQERHHHPRPSGDERQHDWRMGLPLEPLVIVIGVPMILLV